MKATFPNQEHFVSLVTFNGLGIKPKLFAKRVKTLSEIDANIYQPDASTPLYDAIGFSVNKLRQKLVSKKDYNVLVTILTDGEENASREYSMIRLNPKGNKVRLNLHYSTYKSP